MIRRIALAALITSASGCSLAYDTPPIFARNECATSTECVTGSICKAGACVATSADLAGLILEVRPHADASYGATTSFYFTPATSTKLDGENKSGFTSAFTAALYAPVASKGRVARKDLVATPGCEALPAALTFYELPPFPGLPSNPPVEVSTKESDGNTFEASLRPGRYEVYVQPAALPGCPDTPPALVQGVMVSDAAPDIDIVMPAPTKLSVTFTVPIASSVGDWTVDVVEPHRGTRISSVYSIEQSGVSFTVDATIDFVWPEVDAPILRLVPPDPGHPTVYWDLSSAAQNKENPTIALSIQDLFINPRKVSFHLARAMAKVPAVVTIKSRALLGDAGNNATFSLEGISAPAGQVDVGLPPGQYVVRVFPTDPSLAITDVDLDVPKPLSPQDDTCVCGKEIEVLSKIVAQGEALTPLGEPLSNVRVAAAPSFGATSFWRDQHLLSPLTTRPVSTQADEAGHFVLLIDPGTSDISIQPDPYSAFSWMVTPRFQITGDMQLPDFVLPSPVFLNGSIVDPLGNVITNADVNAWLPIPSGDGVVQIATASTNADGTYTLILPSVITQ